MLNEQFKNTVIVSDMDGTFLGSNASLVPKNLEAIKDFTASGGVFTLATGRCIRALERIFKDAEQYVNSPAILCGGAYLYDFEKKEQMNSHPLNFDRFLPVLQGILEEVPEAGCRLSYEDGFYCPAVSPNLKNYLDTLPPHLVHTGDPAQYKNKFFYKCVFQNTPEVNSKVLQALERYDLSPFSYTASARTVLEVLDQESTKGTAIASLRKHYGKKARIICVGDYDNDLDMLKVCDIAACPANACDKVKEIASIQLCDHREGAIADLINQLGSTK